MTDRLPPLDPSTWTEVQRQSAQAVTSGPRGGLVGPFVPLLRSPELMDHVQRLGEYLRYRNALGHALGELAICITARHWTQQVEWAIHAPIAEQAGVAASTLQAIARGERPDALTPDQGLVYDFCTELYRSQRVGDAVWQAFVARFGEQAALDLTGICGYYSLLSMVMNVAQTPTPPSSWAPLAPLNGRASR
ncbi:carboxymuconolactone decarboxylase [Comamonas serinivorans]|uniref:Carboxymuconolactone decarboxylase n=1 Tax=Comamonas serinivorans TaxID=1082851 RepID=A0A1Y0EPC3_9BURK|nr:carboxymuconolactone decarboxylase [Comamonas serinivorans]ARU05132.1 carboxymuconolactone decarboxylase [Comamonas serinivorans]